MGLKKWKKSVSKKRKRETKTKKGNRRVLENSKKDHWNQKEKKEKKRNKKNTEKRAREKEQNWERKERKKREMKESKKLNFCSFVCSKTVKFAGIQTYEKEETAREGGER